MWPFRKRKPKDDYADYLATMKIVRETPWSREYRGKDDKTAFIVSRFRDGSCSITLDELRRKWPDWPLSEKVDFSQSFNHFQGEGRADIFRFLMKQSEHDVWSAIAGVVAITLPVGEVLPFLRNCCETCEVGRGSNYFQALWFAKSPDALGILQTSLDRIWKSPDLMKPEEFCNFIAFDAIWCIDALLRLGESTESLKSHYETLKRHPSMSPQVTQWLSSYFEKVI